MIITCLTGCTLIPENPDGTINKSETTIYKTNSHTEEEINNAVYAFKESFKNTFYKCNLMSVEYGLDEDTEAIEKALSEQNNNNESIALIFKFKTSKEEYKALESDTEYTFYGYMVKDNDKWELKYSGEKLV